MGGSDIDLNMCVGGGGWEGYESKVASRHDWGELSPP